MKKQSGKNRSNKMNSINAITKHKTITMWIVIGVMVGLIAYGSWLGQNISLR